MSPRAAKAATRTIREADRDARRLLACARREVDDAVREALLHRASRMQALARAKRAALHAAFPKGVRA